MNKQLINKINGSFNHDSNYEKYPDFIRDIHFPCFKGLAPNSVVTFNFPLTVLVGENGCGKSSVLQALETAPEGRSYSQKYFSTKIDPIPDEPRPAFWYSYYNSEAKRIVQILNVRIKKESNPDYWEPSRPVAKYGMELFPKEFSKKPGAFATRWKGTTREVLYLDFRGELSAFDKYFYFGNRPNTLTLKTKQDYIRYYSGYLKKIIEGEITSEFTLRNIKKIEKIDCITEKEIEIISAILDKSYSEITYIQHSFYRQEGESIFFKLNNIESETFKGKYTEAFAGSGESAAVKLVHKIYNAPKGTLVLLDEPDISLHPGAQKRLIEFLLEQCFAKGLQIVLTTHSPAIVEELPKEAIVLLHQMPDGTFLPKCSVEPELAFQYIGHNNLLKPRIVVEDNAAKELIVSCLRLHDERAIDSIDIAYHAGGAEDILKEAVSFARFNLSNIYILLDGDKNRGIIPENEHIPKAELDDIIKTFTGISASSFSFLRDGGIKEKKEEQLEQEKRIYLQYLKSHLLFFPKKDPEEIMWEASTCDKPMFAESDYKKRIELWAQKSLGKDINSSDVSTFRRILCNNLDPNNADIKIIIQLLSKIIENTVQNK